MKIHLYPGMGATAEMHKNIKINGFQIESHNWPCDFKFNSFDKLAKYLIVRDQIKSNDIIAGSSMGGMIACEISKNLNKNLVILIGSCHNPNAIPLHILSGIGSSLLPDFGMKVIGCKGRISLLAKMASEVGVNFIRQSLLSLRDWNGVSTSEMGTHYSIHGVFDPVIPYYKENHDEKVICGGHFIGISHHFQISKFIQKIAQQVDAPEPASRAR